MKVLLLADVEGIGVKDDVKDVKDGYARNYLIPRGLAVEASPGVLSEVGRRREARQRSKEREIQTARDLVGRLDGRHFHLKARASAEGRLFGSITSMDIAAAIRRDLSIDVDRRRLEMDGSIRTVGAHEVRVRLGSGQLAKIEVIVQPEQGDTHGK